jgi:hypothetical protein
MEFTNVGQTANLQQRPMTSTCLSFYKVCLLYVSFLFTIVSSPSLLSQVQLLRISQRRAMKIIKKQTNQMTPAMTRFNMNHLSEIKSSHRKDNGVITEQTQAVSSAIMCPGAFPLIDHESESSEAIQDNVSETGSVDTVMDSDQDNNVDVDPADHCSAVVSAPPLIDFKRLEQSTICI